MMRVVVWVMVMTWTTAINCIWYSPTRLQPLKGEKEGEIKKDPSKSITFDSHLFFLHCCRHLNWHPSDHLNSLSLGLWYCHYCCL